MLVEQHCGLVAGQVQEYQYFGLMAICLWPDIEDHGLDEEANIEKFELIAEIVRRMLHLER